jgi:hypothetical protein
MGMQGNFGYNGAFRFSGGMAPGFQTPASNAIVPQMPLFTPGMMDTLALGLGGIDLRHQDAKKINVVEIDDFQPERPPDTARDKGFTRGKGEYFNHGETVASILETGGTEKKLGKDVQVNKINVGQGQAMGQQVNAISSALSRVITSALLDPAKVDVVNLSQQEAAATPDSLAVRQKIKMLQEMGIPVVIAAGNLGPNTPNQLAYKRGFVVQSADKKGKLNKDSGPGNLLAEGRETSFAAPQLAPLIGSYKQEGYSISQIQGLLQQHEGAFKGADFEDISTADPTA